jgi:hypothetical protein
MKKIIYGILIFCLVNSIIAFNPVAAQDDENTKMSDVEMQALRLENEVEYMRGELARIRMEEERKKSEHERKVRKVGPPQAQSPKVIHHPTEAPPPHPVVAHPTVTHPPEHRRVAHHRHHRPHWVKRLVTVCFRRGPPNPCNPCEDDVCDSKIVQEMKKPMPYCYRKFYSLLGTRVTTSPFIGLRSAFYPTDVVVNLPTMNEDLRFLREHQKLDAALKCVGACVPDTPIIVLSGKIEGITFLEEDYNDRATRSDIDIASARLDVFVEVSHGVHAFMAFEMDNSNFDLLSDARLDIELTRSGSRIFNSRVFISRAFFTIGDLDRFPVYFTMGQMFVPFGRYASNIITSPLTQLLGRTNERAILLGFYQSGFYGSTYVYRGDSNVNAPGINAWGTNWGYDYTSKAGTANVGIGYIANIADSTGFQATGAAQGFFGFARNHNTEILKHRVPGVDFHGEFSIGDFGINSEYIWTTCPFAAENLSFNGRGAKPGAAYFELYYNFNWVERPASIAIGGGRTFDALALALPERSYVGCFNISIWKNTIESLEIRHDINYPASDFAGGNGAVPALLHSVGGNRTTITAQIGVYF